MPNAVQQPYTGPAPATVQLDADASEFGDPSGNVGYETPQDAYGGGAGTLAATLALGNDAEGLDIQNPGSLYVLNGAVRTSEISVEDGVLAVVVRNGAGAVIMDAEYNGDGATLQSIDAADGTTYGEVLASTDVGETHVEWSQAGVETGGFHASPSGASIVAGASGTGDAGDLFTAQGDGTALWGSVIAALIAGGGQAEGVANGSTVDQLRDALIASGLMAEL